jgi:hypothetical protein
MVAVYSSGFTRRYLDYIRNGGVTDYWQLGGMSFSASDSRISTNSNIQNGHQFYMGYNNAANNGLTIAPLAQPNVGVKMLEVDREAGTVVFAVEKDNLKISNGADVKGYSDNLTTQKWGVTGSTGAGTFDGGVRVGGTSGPTWTSGTGAPVGACGTGSLYTRTDGGAGSTLYACEAGAWAAK